MPERELKVLPLGLIDPPRHPLRESAESEGISELADSMRAVGLLQPITVVAHEGRYEVLVGHRRYLASKYLGWTEIPAVVVAGDGPSWVSVRAVENLQRRDFRFNEEVGMVVGLYDALGQDVDLVAETLCRGRGWVDDRLLSQLWPAEFHEAMAAKELTLGAAKELMAITDEHDRMFYFGHCVASGASVALVKSWRQAWQLSRVCQDPTISGNAAAEIGPAPLPAQLPCFFCGVGIGVEAIAHLRFCEQCAELVAAHRPEAGVRNRPLTAEDFPREEALDVVNSPT